MYSYEWDSQTGGLLLNSTPLTFSKEPRPVYYKELDILGLDKYWNYAKNDSYPYMWAEANSYYYRGRLVAKTKGGATYSAPELILLDEPEPDGEPLRFVDIPAMVEKNKLILEKLSRDTIKKIYNIFTEYQNKVDIFYVAFSGGKDSIVALDLVQRALPHNNFMVLFGDTGMEFPDTYDVLKKIRAYCEEEKIEFLTAKSDYSPEVTWKQFGPPSQTMRWCCSVHKTAPQIIKLREFLNNAHFRGMAFTGIRGDESASRSEYEDVSLGEKVRGQYSCHPILEWNSAELFCYMFERELPLNEAYKKGNSRAGCLVCPLAANKNMFFKEVCYCNSVEGRPSTTTFNDIILQTTSKEFSNEAAVKEFMNIAGWKARRSGKELAIAKAYCTDSFENGVFRIKITQERTDWHEWIKTIGDVVYKEDDSFDITYDNHIYKVKVNKEIDATEFVIDIGTNTRRDIYFMADFKVVMRKTAYCISCRVCEANCPNGFIKFKDGNVSIDSKCVKCKKCHEVFHGCLVANSMRLPKGDKKMGSINRYGNMGIEYDWVKAYFKKKDEFWTSPHSLGTNMVKNLRSFLSDAGITEKSKFSFFGEVVDSIGIETDKAWALMVCNLVYTAEFNWWIKNIKLGETHTPDSIAVKFDEDMTDNVKNHVLSAYKNIFISIQQLNTIGLGQCEYEIRGNKRYANSYCRSSWENADPKVILYSLYKFAEACGGYYQFTLTRLLDHDIDSDGISPTEIFGLDREKMEKILNGLTFNCPEFIDASFALGLDNITLRSDKKSEDVLKLF